MRITILIVLATLSVSCAPLLIKLCEYNGVQPGLMSGGRMLGTAFALLPFAYMARFQLKLLTPREGKELVGSGLMLGAHLLLFIAAFPLTSFESAVLLLAAQPILAAILGWFMLKEKTSMAALVALVIAAAGLVFFVYEDLNSRHSLIGDALVLIAGVCVVLSIIWGRRLRRKLDFTVYSCAVFLVGGLLCIGYSLVAGEDYSSLTPAAWGWMALLILIPTLAGHGMFYYLVKHVPVFIINLVILAEPVLSIAAKFVIDDPEVFGEFELTGLKIGGGVVLLAGVGFGLYLRQKGRELALPGTEQVTMERVNSSMEKAETGSEKAL